MPGEKRSEYTVYIVDDDESIRRALGRLIRAAGMCEQGFASGSELMASISPKTRGCVLVDIRMPGLAGHDMLEQLRVRGAKLPVIAISTEDDPATRKCALELGAVAFFRKPVDGDALLAAILWAIGKPK